jgi:hypothetical protein|nr:MAG TPA: hypothetical protein [Caudoviricetes sp.]
MAIQDLINEVNSIQTKKQAIKEAITAKGVTSEGKLSKFADEIKQISTGEPDWYILNRIRHDNGNEGIVIRTNTDEKSYFANLCQVTELGAGTTQDGSFLSSRVATDFYIMNGSCFTNKETICRRTLKTLQENNLALDVHNDNIKTLAGANRIYQLLFSDINTYSWLKPFKNNSLVGANAVYLKAEEVNITNSIPMISGVRDIVSTSMTPMPIMYDSKQYQAVMIDSTLLLAASRMQPINNAGFIRIAENNKKLYSVRLQPYSYSHNLSDFAYIPYMGVNLYENLPMGNYVYVYATRDNTYIVFIGINYIVGDGSKKKNIEVYPYEVLISDSHLGYNYYVPDKPVEFYLNFSQQGQRQLQSAPSLNIFRKQVLAANGTPEARASNFLTGSDALLEFSASKITNGRLPARNTTANLFKKNSRADNIFRYQASIFEGGYIATSLVEDIRLNKKIAGFIRLNDDSNTMFPIELEKVPDEIKNNPKISYYRQYGYFLSCIAPNGILPERNNKMMVFVKDIQGDITCFYVKKGNDYITNDMLSTNPKNTQLYITTDTETQNYIKSKPLTDIWNEINSLNKDDFDAYNEQ